MDEEPETTYDADESCVDESGTDVRQMRALLALAAALRRLAANTPAGEAALYLAAAGKLARRAAALAGLLPDPPAADSAPIGPLYRPVDINI